MTLTFSFSSFNHFATKLYHPHQFPVPSRYLKYVSKCHPFFLYWLHHKFVWKCLTCYLSVLFFFPPDTWAQLLRISDSAEFPSKQMFSDKWWMHITACWFSQQCGFSTCSRWFNFIIVEKWGGREKLWLGKDNFPL